MVCWYVFADYRYVRIPSSCTKRAKRKHQLSNHVRTCALRNVRNIYTQHSCTTDYTATTVDSGAGMEHS